MGTGFTLTLRDARVLRDQLLKHEDWDVAGHAYAQEHDRYYDVIHKVNNWWTELFLALGPEAEARRAKALPLIEQDGPECPITLSVGQNYQQMRQSDGGSLGRRNSSRTDTSRIGARLLTAEA